MDSMDNDRIDKKARPIIAYLPDGVRLFPSIKEASDILGIEYQKIYRSIRQGIEVDNCYFNYYDITQ